MPAPYPKELRERVVNAWREGGSTQREIAQRFMLGEQTIVRWLGRLRATGSVTPDSMGGARRPYVVDEAGAKLIREILDCVPDTTLPELCEAYVESRGVKVSPQTMSDTVRRLGYTQKRGSSAGKRRADRMSLRSARRS